MIAEKQKALELALDNIERDFGKGAIMLLGEAARAQGEYEALPTGSLSLDLALGRGGVPPGRLI